MSDLDNPVKNCDPFKPYKGRLQAYERIPENGRDQAAIIQELQTVSEEENVKWNTGRVSGTFYHAGDEHRAFLNKVFSFFSHVNTIQFDLCPSMAKFESEIISMTANLLHGDASKAQHPEDQVCGTVTSGGSESIAMALKVYRDKARAEKGIIAPEIIMPKTAHPAFSKAGQYFGIKIIEVPVDPPDFRVDPCRVEEQINANTVAVVGSAGNYPYGLIDPLEALSEIAIKRGIWFHVDGCLGGFILPWIERLGFEVPPFDFRLPGLTSMSADTHKFGYALKGTSVVLYRNKDFRRYQYFSFPDWPGGIYASPTAAGSRSGGLSAAAWAAMVYLGEEGYLKAAAAIMQVAEGIRKGVESIPELKLIGNPTFIISFRSDEVDVYHVNDFMKIKGWRFNCLQLPPALHFCVTLPQTLMPGLAGEFVEDLNAGVQYAKNNAGKPAQSSALYGLAGSAEGNQAVNDLLCGVFDHMYSI
ncbi:MAG: aspartate aminotransferase family protein [Desulfobacterales bacterium]|nr:aspartate aminotransferase family protein [Desulfobacterales bacterium]